MFRKVLFVGALAGVIAAYAFALSGCTETQKSINKDLEAEREGLSRITTIYSAEGQPFKAYEGKYNIEPSADIPKLKFIIDGKRIIVYSLDRYLVITEEK